MDFILSRTYKRKEGHAKTGVAFLDNIKFNDYFCFLLFLAFSAPSRDLLLDSSERGARFSMICPFGVEL